ncbi:MAG TPA: LysR family transcriptional regulator [Microvirga sp.]
MTNWLAVVTAARLGSIIGTAAELGVQQSAITWRIQRLENVLGVRLFYRLHRGVASTEAGQHFITSIEQGLSSILETL